MTATLTAPDTERAYLEIDTEDGVTSFAWGTPPWDFYTEVWLTDDDPELLALAGELPFLYNDGKETTLTNLAIFAAWYRVSGLFAHAWPSMNTNPEDPVIVACQIISWGIDNGKLTWDADAQTLRTLP